MTVRTASASRFWQSPNLASFLLFAGSIVFAMALAEGILRLVPGLLSVEQQQVVQANPDNLGIFHPYIGFLPRPNNALIIAGSDYRTVAHTDGYGFRNAWPWSDEAEIVTLGDSLTFGYGVEDNEAWPALVEKALPHNRLINLGLSGAGPQQYLRVYETFGKRLRPKVTLVGFFAGNDFADSDTFDRWLRSGANTNFLVFRDFGKPASTSLSLEQPVHDLIKSILWRGYLLASKSWLFNLLNYVRKNLKSGPEETKIFQAPNGSQLILSLRGLTEMITRARPGYPSFDMSVDALKRIEAIAKARRTNVLIVLQPSKEEVYLPLLGQSDLDADPQRALRGTLETLGIPYLDLLPEFRNRAAKGEVLFLRPTVTRIYGVTL